jgi:hypothetical protein
MERVQLQSRILLLEAPEQWKKNGRLIDPMMKRLVIDSF